LISIIIASFDFGSQYFWWFICLNRSIIIVISMIGIISLMIMISIGLWIVFCLDICFVLLA